MITDATNFRPFQPRRLVPAGDEVELDGPGTRFSAGQLVHEAERGSGAVLQLAARKR
jgi:hypothetical protein